MLGEVTMKTKYQIIVIGILIAFCFIGVIVFTNITAFHFINQENTKPSLKTIDATIPVKPDFLGILLNIYAVKIHADEPLVPSSVSLYMGILRENDTIFIENGSIITPKPLVISEKDAPECARQVLLKYGGLPSDAELEYVKTNYLEKVKGSTGEVVERKPISTSVSYGRNIDGMPVVGYRDKIDIDLGENGEILQIHKIWRTLEPIGNTTSLISPSEAIDKIRNRDIVDPPQDMRGIQIDNITLGYYERSKTDSIINLEPVWIFYGKTSSHDPIKIIINATTSPNFPSSSTSNLIKNITVFKDVKTP